MILVIHLSHKLTPFGDFEYIHQVVLDVISDNMASVVQYDKYVSVNIYDTTKNGYYVIKFISEVYRLRNNTTIGLKIISAGELVVKASYIFSVQENNNFYWTCSSPRRPLFLHALSF